MAITRTLTGFELIFTTGPGEMTGDPAIPKARADNPNNVVARATLHLKMVDSEDGEEVVKTVRKETYNPKKMRAWGKQILGLATGDPDGFPGFGKLDTEV